MEHLAIKVVAGKGRVVVLKFDEGEVPQGRKERASNNVIAFADRRVRRTAVETKAASGHFEPPSAA